MKIAAWNLNHRTIKKPIPETAIDVIRSLAADVLVLTEYVDGDDRIAFKQALRDMGLRYVSVSEKRLKHNQVLVASRFQHHEGGLTHPTESHAATNFHPITIPEFNLVIVGIRAPAYKTSAGVKAYWDELTVILGSRSDKKLILVGDVNGDPDAPRSVGGKYMRALRKQGWSIPSPTGEWSFISSDGLRKSRVDHLLASPSLSVSPAVYEAIVNGIATAGLKGAKPISDHAILCCEISSNRPAKNEVIMEIRAEGGSITLYGVRTMTGWIFNTEVVDQTPELIDEPSIEYSTPGVDTWSAALSLFGEKPWHMLSPGEVHQDFRRLILAEVEKRYRQQGSSPYSTLHKWRAACQSTG